jgi:hypothetical protein
MLIDADPQASALDWQNIPDGILERGNRIEEGILLQFSSHYMIPPVAKRCANQEWNRVAILP